MSSTLAHKVQEAEDARPGVVHPPLAPDWQAWLKATSRRSFRFEGRSGSFTARAEQRAGTTYWYAYRKRAGRLHKQYLGRAWEVDEQRLEHIAALLGNGDPVVEAVPRKSPARPSVRQLAAATSTFVGRREELAEVRRLLRRARVLTLTGVGGIGKTRLALAAASAVHATYCDGASFIDLVGVSDSRILVSSLASVVGVKEQPGRELLTLVLEALRPVERLLVLDNCEHLVEGIAPLVEQIASTCPRVRVLTTSRELLGCDGEVVWTVPPLELPGAEVSTDLKRAPDAVKLFVERARLVRQEFSLTERNAAVVARICGLLEGLPLAIELAAARAAVLGLEELELRLGDRLNILRRSSKVAAPRQRTMRAAMDWSFDLLSPSEQRLFDRLAVFSGGWTLEAAEGVAADADGEDTSISDHLLSLCNKSLVRTSLLVDGLTVRYALLETVRQYGREHLAAGGQQEAIRARHAYFFLALAEAADAERRIWGTHPQLVLDRLEQEVDNLRAALRWGVDHRRADIAMRLAAAVWHMWYSRGHYAEGRHWLAEILGLPGARARTAVRVTLLNAAGSLAHRQGDFQASRALEEEAVAIARDLCDPTQVAVVLSSLGISALHQADYSASRGFFAEALAVSRAIGDRPHEVQSMIQLASVDCHAAEYDAARAAGTEALAQARTLESPYLVSYALRTVGYAATGQGDWATATALLQEGLALARKMGDQWLMGETLEGLGHVAMSIHKYRLARTRLAESLLVYRPLGDLRVARSLEGLARIAAQRGAPAHAFRLAGAAARLRETWGYPPSAHEERVLHGWIEAARRVLGSTIAESERNAGRQLSMDQAVDMAMAAVSTPRKDAAPDSSAPHLTPREAEVLRHVARGDSNQEIAAALVISVNTVEHHIASLYGKIGARRRADAVAYAFTDGMA